MRPFTWTRTCLVAAVAAVVGAATGAAARADERLVPVAPDTDLTQVVQSTCAAPASPECARALDYLRARATAALLVLTERQDAQAAAFARLTADSADAGLRAAAARALATPFVADEDAPLLAELADDPVSAVRAAALRSLASSRVPSAQLLARRAGAFGGSSDAELAVDTPDTPPAAAAMGVPLPTDAVFLFFASAPETGRFAWWTTQAPAAVMAALRGKAKKGPLTPEQFRAQAEEATASPDLEEGEMPSADDMARAMAMAEQMMKAMEGAQGGSPEEQAAAMQRAAGGLAVFDADLAGKYEDAELFGEARLFVVPVAGSADAVVAVYRDLAVGGTGITVHRGALATP